MKTLASIRLSIPPDALAQRLDSVIRFCAQAFVLDAEEVVQVENNNPNADGFGVYALLSGETMHVADRRNRLEADEVCADLNNVLAEHKTLTRKEA